MYVRSEKDFKIAEITTNKNVYGKVTDTKLVQRNLKKKKKIKRKLKKKKMECSKRQNFRILSVGGNYIYKNELVEIFKAKAQC